MNLFLFSASYPFVSGGESNFLNTEVGFLKKAFDRVIIVPETHPSREMIDDFSGAEVDLSYARTLNSLGLHHLFRMGVSSRIFRLGIRERKFPRFSPVAWRRLISFTGKAELARQWVLDWFRRNGSDERDSLFYTYWFDHAAVGIGSAKEELPDLRLVSRVHGYDLYEEKYYKPPFWPCRELALSLVDRLFPDSDAGTNYLRDRYPEFSARYETSLLGVTDPGFMTKPSTDGVFRIVSCSMIRPEKRVQLIFEGVLHAARQRPYQKIEWFHFGNGVLRDELQQAADSQYPSNARAYFEGYTDPETLMRCYREKPFDLFVNLSETEGTSVSMMEAISCGIPVLATAVGGNAEIVSEENGMLLSANPAPAEVSSAIYEFIENVKKSDLKRRGSMNVWKRKYNAHSNYLLFAQKLRSIRALML